MKIQDIKLLIDPTRDDRVHLGGGVAVPRYFSARLVLSGVGAPAVELDIAAEAGRARAVAMRVVEEPGRGLHGMTIDSLSLSEMLNAAVERMGWMLSSVEFMDVRNSTATATRRRVSDERLERVRSVMDEYGSLPARAIEAVMKAEGVGRRQAFRLMKLAQSSAHKMEES